VEFLFLSLFLFIGVLYLYGSSLVKGVQELMMYLNDIIEKIGMRINDKKTELVVIMNK